jgi:hypothetical protein
VASSLLTPLGLIGHGYLLLLAPLYTSIAIHEGSLALADWLEHNIAKSKGALVQQITLALKSMEGNSTAFLFQKVTIWACSVGSTLVLTHSSSPCRASLKEWLATSPWASCEALEYPLGNSFQRFLYSRPGFKRRLSIVVCCEFDKAKAHAITLHVVTMSWCSMFWS